MLIMCAEISNVLTRRHLADLCEIQGRMFGYSFGLTKVHSLQTHQTHLYYSGPTGLSDGAARIGVFGHVSQLSIN